MVVWVLVLLVVVEVLNKRKMRKRKMCRKSVAGGTKGQSALAGAQDREHRSQNNRILFIQASFN